MPGQFAETRLVRPALPAVVEVVGIILVDDDPGHTVSSRSQRIVHGVRESALL